MATAERYAAIEVEIANEGAAMSRARRNIEALENDKRLLHEELSKQVGTNIPRKVFKLTEGRVLIIEQVRVLQKAKKCRAGEDPPKIIPKYRVDVYIEKVVDDASD